MGMDIVAIMRHSMSVEELCVLPDKINTWTDVFKHYSKYNENPKKQIDAKWDYVNPTPEMLIAQFEGYEKHLSNFSTFSISSSFGDFKINRNTIIACPWSQHKYGNLYDYESRRYVIIFMRLIAKELSSEKIIYCPDSSCSTEILYDKAYDGMSIDEIEKFGLNLFGKIPETLTEAIYNYFFIDDLNLILEDYPKDSYLFNRNNEEYFLKAKFGKQFIIHRI